MSRRRVARGCSVQERIRFVLERAGSWWQKKRAGARKTPRQHRSLRHCFWFYMFLKDLNRETADRICSLSFLYGVIFKEYNTICFPEKQKLREALFGQLE